jgi:RNA polymerase sigma factor (sigma-70 family)
MNGTVTAVAGLRMRSRRADDSALARRAAAGDRDAFAELYRRHESRVFNLCYRILGSRDEATGATRDAFVGVVRRLPGLGGREPAFGTCVLSSARDACHDLIQRRVRAQPSYEMCVMPAGGGVAFAPGDLEDDPERKALLEAHNEEIRSANLALPLRRREVLALRELEELAYDEIAELMEMDRNSVAQLIARARLNLWDALRGTALESTAATSPDCEGALPLIALEQDGQLEGNSNAAGWLQEHLMHCHPCLVERDAMLEAGVSYRAWAPVAAGPLLFRETMARAAEQMAADQSDTMPRHEPRRAVTGAAAGGAGGAAAGAGGAALGAGGAALGAGGAAAGAVSARAGILRHRRRHLTLIGVLACLLVLVVLALAAAEDDPVETAVPAAQEKQAVTVEEPEAGQAASSADKPAKKKRRRRKPETPVPVATPEPVAPAPVAVAEPTPAETEARREPRRPRNRVNVERRPAGDNQRAPAPEITPAPPPQQPAETTPIPPPPPQPPPEPAQPPVQPPAPPCTGGNCPPGQPPPGL